MKNQKTSNIPPLIQGNTVINDAKIKSEHLNDLFVSKATVQVATILSLNSIQLIQFHAAYQV